MKKIVILGLYLVVYASQSASAGPGSNHYGSGMHTCKDVMMQNPTLCSNMSSQVARECCPSPSSSSDSQTSEPKSRKKKGQTKGTSGHVAH